MILNVHEHRQMVVDYVFQIGVAQVMIGALNFLLNDYTVSRLIYWFDEYYNIPPPQRVINYLILLFLTSVGSSFAVIIPVAKYYIYEIYLELGNHSTDWELWFDITKSCFASLGFVYSLFVTITGENS